MYTTLYLLTILMYAPPTEIPEGISEYRSRIQQLAIKLELMDEHEITWLLYQKQEIHRNLTLLHERYEEFNDAPASCEAELFHVTTDYIVEQRTLNSQYTQYLLERITIDLPNAQRLQSLIDLNKKLNKIWEKVHDAKCTYYNVTTRRRGLKDLKDVLGPQMYYAGQLPPALPVWLFEPINP